MDALESAVSENTRLIMAVNLLGNPNEFNRITKIIGGSDEAVIAQAQRVEQHMNYQVTEECEEYFDEMDRMLFMLPLMGIGFKKT